MLRYGLDHGHAVIELLKLEEHLLVRLRDGGHFQL